MSSNKSIAVKILGKDYHVACPDEEVHRLFDAALLLDSKMKEIKASGRVIGLERIAVMAALNLAYELQTQKDLKLKENVATEQRIEIMCDKLSEALA